jgi:hypothetical protein
MRRLEKEPQGAEGVAGVAELHRAFEFQCAAQSVRRGRERRCMRTVISFFNWRQLVAMAVKADQRVISLPSAMDALKQGDKSREDWHDS